MKDFKNLIQKIPKSDIHLQWFYSPLIQTQYSWVV